RTVRKLFAYTTGARQGPWFPGRLSGRRLLDDEDDRDAGLAPDPLRLLRPHEIGHEAVTVGICGHDDCLAIGSRGFLADALRCLPRPEHVTISLDPLASQALHGLGDNLPLLSPFTFAGVQTRGLQPERDPVDTSD